MLENTVTTFVQSKNGGKLSSRRVLYHLPERLFGYDPLVKEVIQTALSPVSVALCPTPTCVRSCTFCSNTVRNKANCQKKIEIGYRRFTDLIGELVAMDVQGVSVAGGGEPLSYNGPIAESLFLGCNLSFKIGIHTNGVLLQKVLAKEVLISGNITYFNVSVVAHTPELYEKVCRVSGNQFLQVEKGILEMLELRQTTGSEIMIGVKILLCRENFESALEIFNYFKGLGVDNILIRCVGNFEPGQDVELSGEQISRLAHVFRYGLRMSNDQIDAVTGRGTKELLPMPSRCWISALQYTAGVDPDGEVYLCSQWSRKDYSIGNINQADFPSIWGSTRHKEVAECLNAKLKSGQCHPLLCRHYYSNLAIDAFVEGLISSLPKGEQEKGYGRFI
ncbi:MAG TPA: radical SAM protein [Candidatus Paceibacterota bacterium]|nr:radical SAM protein [Candidatus Paceibacterota bacterium]